MTVLCQWCWSVLVWVVTCRARTLCTYMKCLLIFILICVICIVRLYERHELCSETASITIIDALCSQYRTGRVVGAFCGDLCSKSSNFTYTQCLNYNGGKIIFQGIWNGNDVVVKSKHPYIENYDPVGFLDEASQKVVYPEINEFVKMVSESVKFNTGVKLSGDQFSVLSRVWVGDLSDLFTASVSRYRHEENKRRALLTSLWALLQQDEYATTMLSRSSHIPVMYGTCGHFYAVEYIPPNTSLTPGLFSPAHWFSRYSWKNRVRLALKMIQLSAVLNNTWSQPVHLCDVKNENFGVDSRGVIKLIDMDMMFYESRIGEVVSGDRSCTSHADCGFFDCHGWCDHHTSRCSPHRTNNNLQAICDKLLFSQLLNGYQGLLRDLPPNVEHATEHVLHSCVYPTLSRDQALSLPGCIPPEKCSHFTGNDVRFQADSKIYKQLYQTLSLFASD